jgi:putative spermidine/putrescine transport system ATP-binding protein
MVDLVLRRLRKEFGGQTAVEPTDLVFRDGELTALLGPSGCGKTTLLRMIAGLEAPSGGQILLGERDITALPAHRRRFGMVFQNFALFPHLSVVDNVAYSLAIAGEKRPARLARARELLALVRLDGMAERRIGELSGGQRQRVAIARALAQSPDIFLLDEPMSALDAKLRAEMQVELRLLQQRLGITTIVVTHDQTEAMTMADRIVVMSRGRTEQTGAPQEIYDRPANAFVAGFIGSSNLFDGVAEGGSVRVDETVLTVEPGARFISGAPVTLACRPERARLAGEATAVNCIPARVALVRSVGASRDVFLETPIGSMTITAPAASDGPSPKAGEAVFVVLPPPALQVFPRAAADAAA